MKITKTSMKFSKNLSEEQRHKKWRMQRKQIQEYA